MSSQKDIAGTGILTIASHPAIFHWRSGVSEMQILHRLHGAKLHSAFVICAWMRPATKGVAAPGTRLDAT
jgi:hypothetical protein